MSTADHRGGFLGYVFIANCRMQPFSHAPSQSLIPVTDLGISIAYWLSFGLSYVNNGYSAVRWRFLLAFQCFPALLLLAGVRLLPDSPRYLASAGRYDEAREVLEHLRGGNGAEVEKEFAEICVVAEDSRRASPLHFAKVLVGRGSGMAPHLGRRAWLSLWIQIMASWSGITVSQRPHLIAVGIPVNLLWRLGCHSVLSCASESGGIQRDQAEWARWWSQHHWHHRNHHQRSDCGPTRSSKVFDRRFSWSLLRQLDRFASD